MFVCTERPNFEPHDFLKQNLLAWSLVFTFADINYCINNEMLSVLEMSIQLSHQRNCLLVVQGSTQK